jgi:hypothetical protein
MSKRISLWCLSILLTAFLGGCSDSPSEPDRGTVDLQLVLSQSTVQSGERLAMRLAVTNHRSETVRLEVWGCMSNFQIYRGSDVVWDFAALAICPQGTTQLEIPAGESRNFGASWIATTPGTYEARAQLLTGERMSSPSVSFRVEG